MTKKELKDVLEKHKKWLYEVLNGERADLRNVNLSYADLSLADLSLADLRNADLMGADLRSANLRDADLRSANLSNANLRVADLRDADLTGAFLTDANLIGADLTGADLTNADFWDANFSSVLGKSIISIQLNTSVKNRVINYIPEIDRVSAGCFHGTLEGLKKRVEIAHKDNDTLRNRYYRAIQFIEDTIKDYDEELKGD